MTSGDPSDALCICGPTSSGKSEVAVLVAQALDGEIINADSRQTYRGLGVGTGAPTPDQLARVPHHLYGFVDPCERYSAGAYVEAAVAAIAGVRARGRRPIVVGGTGLYIEALAGTMPLDRAVAGDEVRQRVRREALTHPHEVLHEWLAAIAPDAGARVERGDRYRTLRALESALAVRAGSAPPVRAARVREALRIVVLDVSPETSRARIAARVRAMFDGGLVEEAIDVERRCPQAPALTGLGYAEALALYHGAATRGEAETLAVGRTIRYAKRQRTWFRRMRAAARVDATAARVAAAAIVRLARESSLPA